MAANKQGSNAGGMPPSKALVLEQMVDYSEGSIVSRALVQSKVGTVTLFAFDKGISQIDFRDCKFVRPAPRHDRILGGWPVSKVEAPVSIDL